MNSTKVTPSELSNIGLINTDLTISPYTPEATPAILDLTRQSLGDTPATRKTAAYWRWKHQANPFGPSYGLCAWDDAGRILAGLRLLMRWHFLNPDGQAIRAVRAVDTATHPAYRRRGIFTTLTEAAVAELTAEGVQLIFNTPNGRSLPGYLKLGWQLVETWPIFIQVLQPLRLLTRLVRRQPVTPSLPEFDQYFKPGVIPWADFARQYRAEIPDLLANWEIDRSQVGLRTPRNLSYLQWRYGQHPHLQYGFFPLSQAGGLAGFAILRPNLRYGLKEIVLTELVLRKPAVELGQLLLAKLAKQLKGDYVAAHFATGTVERRLLDRTSFLRVPRRGMIFTVRALNPAAQDLLRPAAWDLSLGDLELF